MAVSCLDYALHYTSRFPKTEKELRIQLLTKGYVSLDIDKTLTFLKEKDFINDEKFTEAYLRSECARKGKPMISVLKKLREKGIDKHIIQKISAEIQDEIDEGIADRIKHEIDLLKKKDMEGFEIIQKLMKKGYKLGDIKRVVEKNQK